jgi:hypothetical protein
MKHQDLRRYRITLGFFIVALALSGITAFPLLTELDLLVKLLGVQDSSTYPQLTGLQHWISFVHHGLSQTYAQYPFVGYGTDWLAFGHLVIAMFFVGPWKDPVANAWVLRVGLVACAAVVPLAFICGAVRGIPMQWRLIDCSFGVFGALPLLYCLRLTPRNGSAAQAPIVPRMTPS